VLHAGATAALAARPDAWPWIVGTLVADHSLIALGGLVPRSRLLGPNLRRVEPAGRPEVVLTFDDGPHPERTPRVLDLLDRAGCTASFFFVGERAERHPDLVAETAARGHGVENHTHTHPHTFAFYGPARIAREIDRAQDAIEGITGRTPRYVRAPAGIRNAWLDPVLHRRGLSLVSWTRRGYDAVDRRPDAVAARLTRGLAPGDILLLHDGAEVAVEALTRLLDGMRSRGLAGLRLPETPPHAPF
jgi:peptidoglycan/xylan/chitin deacetylase (PgdA/CDA1 family)